MNDQKRKEFLENFLDIQIDLNKNKDIKSLSSQAKYLKLVPKKLYKFRNCNNYENISILREKKAFFAYPKTWYDKKDGQVAYDFEGDLEKIKEIPNKAFEKRIEKILKEFINNFDNTIDELPLDLNDLYKNYYNLNYGTFDSIRFQIHYSRILDKNIFKKLYKKVLNYVKLPIEQKIDFIIKNSINQTIMISKSIINSYGMLCLTENYKNEVLWERYANYGTGFCIEYDIYNKNFSRYVNSIIPITYGEKEKISFIPRIKLALSNGELDLDEIGKLTSINFSAMFTKDITYSEEREWRIIGPNGVDFKKSRISSLYENKPIEDKGKMFDFDFVSSLYLGENISEENEKELIDIAKELNVPIYKRKYSEINCEWEFIEIDKWRK